MTFGSQEFNDTLMNIIRGKYRHPYYETAVKLAKDMSVHVYGDKPEELLNRVRPGEDEAIKSYRITNYEPTTKAPCGKAIKIVSKIFNPNLSSIIFKDTDNSRKLKEYTMDYFPMYNSIIVYNKDVTLRKMIADANALQVVKPAMRPQNDAEKVKPVVVIYPSQSVWNWDFEHFLIFISKEKVRDINYYVFEYIDYREIIRFRASSPNDDTVDIEIIEDYSYIHNFVDKKRGDSQIPAWRLGGNSIPLPDGEVMYESFFADAQAHWNLSIIHESDVLGAFIKHMNPQRMVIGDECNNQKEIEGIFYKCHNGMMRAANGSMMICDLCGGSGKYASSPYQDHVVLKSKLEDSNNSSIEPVSYVRVPTDATKLLSDRADAMVAKGNAAINMDIEDKVGENQSGIAKVYDRSAQNNTIFDIASRMFDVLINNQFYFINKWMNGTEDGSAGRDTDDNLPQVNKPTQFNIETVSELIDGFKVSKESGIDKNVLQAKALEIIGRDMETNPERKKYFLNIVDLDPLFGWTQDELDANLSKGLIYKTDVVIHNNTKSFVDRALAANRDFLELPKFEKLNILRIFSEELIASERPRIEPIEATEEEFA